MSRTATTNQTPSTGSVAMFSFIFNLMTAGWVIKSSSDGTTYNATGMQVTAGASGAGGFGNNDAWVRIQSPAVNGQTREFTVQRGTTNVAWRIVYSPRLGFTGGSPGATTVPSATDAVSVFGGGTDGAPTFANIFNTDGSYRFNTVAGDASTSFGFWMLATLSTTGVTYTAFALEPMLAGSPVSGDTDPCVIYAGTPSSSNQFNSDMVATAKGFLGDLTSGSFVSIPPMQSSVFPAGMGGVNAWTSKEDAVNILWARGAASPYGAKGYGASLLWCGPALNNLDTININSSKDYLYVNGCLLPWDGSTPLV